MTSKEIILRIALSLFIFNINEGETFQWIDNFQEDYYEQPKSSLQRNIKSIKASTSEAINDIVPEVKYVNLNDYQEQGPELIRSRRFINKCKKKFKKLFKKQKKCCKKSKKCKCSKCDKCEQPKKECGYSYDTYEKKCDCKKEYKKKCDCYKKKEYDGKCDCKKKYYGKPNKITVKPIIHLVPITPLNYGCNKGCNNNGYVKPQPAPPKKTAQITKVDVTTFSAPIKYQQAYDPGYGHHGGYSAKKPSGNSYDCEEVVGYSGTSHGYEVLNMKNGGHTYNHGGENEYGNKHTSNYDGGYDKGYVGGDHGYSGSKITALIQPNNKKHPVRIYRSNIKKSPESADDFEYV